MEDVFNHHADRVVNLLANEVARKGRIIDLQELFQCAIFDAFCEIAFGIFPDATISAIEGKKPDFLISFDFCQNVAGERFMIPPLIWHTERLSKYSC